MRIVATLLTLLLVSCSGDPMGPLPGGALKGAVAAAPDDWSAAASADTIQVEFRPRDPYSHNIWCVGIRHDLYIATHGESSRWIQFIADDPAARARIGESIYELTAVKVTDLAERDRVATAYAEKYKIDPNDNWVKAGSIFRLDRRAP